MERDCLGRHRQPGQERGLRPLYPPLPRQWSSKVLRVAMSCEDWERFDALIENIAPEAPTEARAQGIVIARLIELARPPQIAQGPLDWMDWEREKTLRLLREAI